MTNGRQKGSVGEREVARLIQQWWATVDAKAKFVRTPLSGGWGTAQVRSDFRASGDLMTTSFSFPWCVEIKRREGWKLGNVIGGEKSPVWGWWAQTWTAAQEAGADPMLWFRKNNEPWYVMLHALADGTKPVVKNVSYSRVYRPDGEHVIVTRAADLLGINAGLFSTSKGKP
jgi:hypothetical protein